MDERRWEEVALQLVPPGKEVRRTELRKRIAAAFAVEVNSALAFQREQCFPELAAERLRLVQAQEVLQRERESMAEKYAVLQKEQQTVNQLINGFVSVYDALSRYFDWYEGNGDVSEQRSRWGVLLAAWERYKSLRSGK